MDEPSTAKVVVIQHAEEATLGNMRMPLEAAGIALDVRPAWVDWQFDDALVGADGMIILGGPQYAGDDLANRHFPDLLALIRQHYETSRPVLGLCLGGQLIARALGGAVHRHHRGEFGFVEVDGGSEDPVCPRIVEGLRIAQWHDDSFTPPPGATGLLTSAGCPDQGFRLGSCIWGLQGHPELDESILGRWISLRAEDYGDAAGASRLQQDAARWLSGAMAFGSALAANWARQVIRRRSCSPCP